MQSRGADVACSSSVDSSATSRSLLLAFKQLCSLSGYRKFRLNLHGQSSELGKDDANVYEAAGVLCYLQEHLGMVSRSLSPDVNHTH